MSTITIGNVSFSSSQLRQMGMPIMVVMVLAMMLLPLPAWLLDLLFTFNIAVSLMVLLVAVYNKKPLDFATFPTVLLITTLLRLSLNVASTRVVLINGHTGTDAAGKVIEAFGHFLLGGNFAVGFVVFAIIVVINFMVVTKGAGRIAEVAARFTLDAMPGKQMAIDADLNAGLINESEAKKRRTEIAREADFYGAMDGASKFVRGDAIAGILILVINIIGGLVVGMAQHDLSLSQASKNYILLAIGDGLAAQVPALLISIAAGLIVSRVGDGEDMGSEIGKQLFATPQALGLSAGVLALMGLIPGMPNVAFLSLAGLLLWLAYWLSLRKQKTQQEAAPSVAVVTESQEASWDDVSQVDTLGLEVGYRLIPLVDKAQDGDLLKRIKAIRKKFAQEIGFLPAPVHIRDNLELRPGGYRILLKGVVVGEGEIQTSMWLAINPGRVTSVIQGIATQDPAFGLPAQWIESSLREQAQASGYTVVDPATVVATHLSHVLDQYAADMLGRTELQALLEHFTKTTPKLLDDLIPKIISLSTLQRVLQSLLEESVHIRDFKTIVETLNEYGPRTQDTAELSSFVRVALGRAITQDIFGPTGDAEVLALDPELERILLSATQKVPGEMGAIEPSLADRLLRESTAAVDRQEALGKTPALLVPDRLRLPLARLFRRTVSRLRVLAHAEIPDSRVIRVIATLGAR